MSESKYSVLQQPVGNLLGWIKSGEIAIPEIQRPFVWTASKVRDLIDSLYKGYPVGYIIIWRNPDIRLKDGTLSAGKKVLIDGQQRITALTAAVVGQQVLNKEYKKERIKIAYNPLAKEGESFFEVCNSAIERNSIWINDISEILSESASSFKIRKDYLAANPQADEEQVEKRIDALKAIKNSQIGIIELNSDLDIDTVTEIFIRINQKGVSLSNADFVMSKIASDQRHGGEDLRKMIDYFCHMLRDRSFADTLRTNNTEYAQSDDFNKIKWIANYADDLYVPDYVDALRVAYTYAFGRGKFSTLVALLSGRDFENRTNVENIAEQSYADLRRGLESCFDKTSYERFCMLVKSAGFINKKLITSQTTLNIAYALYLKLRNDKLPEAEIQHLIKRWFVMSVLTGRYSGSSETVIERDCKLIAERGLENYLRQIEQGELDEGFWTHRLVDDLNSSSSTTGAYLCYLAAQCKNNDHAFLSDSVTVNSLLQQRGDQHHIFPKNYLSVNGYKKGDYNQVANYVFTEQQTNIKLSDDAPSAYMEKILSDIDGQKMSLSSIKSREALQANLAANCIPDNISTLIHESYAQFLEQRRKLMAEKIRRYYESL